MELRYSQKIGVNRKRVGASGEDGGEGLEVFLPGRGQMTYLGEGRACLGDQE